MDTPEHVIKRVFNARVGELLPEATPLDSATGLSSRLGQPVLLKREDVTPVCSFKLRGAYNHIVSLPEAELRRGVIAASAGNHAQGVAISGHCGWQAGLLSAAYWMQILLMQKSQAVV